jgi:hypothetical protein
MYMLLHDPAHINLQLTPCSCSCPLRKYLLSSDFLITNLHSLIFPAHGFYSLAGRPDAKRPRTSAAAAAKPSFLGSEDGDDDLVAEYQLSDEDDDEEGAAGGKKAKKKGSMGAAAPKGNGYAGEEDDDDSDMSGDDDDDGEGEDDDDEDDEMVSGVRHLHDLYAVHAVLGCHGCPLLLAVYGLCNAQVAAPCMSPHTAEPQLSSVALDIL